MSLRNAANDGELAGSPVFPGAETFASPESVIYQQKLKRRRQAGVEKAKGTQAACRRGRFVSLRYTWLDAFLPREYYTFNILVMALVNVSQDLENVLPCKKEANRNWSFELSSILVFFSLHLQARTQFFYSI